MFKVCTPMTEMLNWIVSCPGMVLACVIAHRKEIPFVVLPKFLEVTTYVAALNSDEQKQKQSKIAAGHLINEYLINKDILLSSFFGYKQIYPIVCYD